MRGLRDRDTDRRLISRNAYAAVITAQKRALEGTNGRICAKERPSWNREDRQGRGEGLHTRSKPRSSPANSRRRRRRKRTGLPDATVCKVLHCRHLLLPLLSSRSPSHATRGCPFYLGRRCPTPPERTIPPCLSATLATGEASLWEKSTLS